ncbi:hypothetical protein [Streptomyces scopuliridis]|uniref:hypothetical protein n=1 Tax=Streptomyces scopuliridis TaxID=452529 RepID=UPI00369A727C
MDSEPAPYTDTHPYPDVTVREHPNTHAGSNAGPTYSLFVTGWFVGKYKTETGVLAAAERVSKRPAQN